MPSIRRFIDVIPNNLSIPLSGLDLFERVSAGECREEIQDGRDNAGRSSPVELLWYTTRLTLFFSFTCRFYDSPFNSSLLLLCFCEVRKLKVPFPTFLFYSFVKNTYLINETMNYSRNILYATIEYTQYCWHLMLNISNIVAMNIKLWKPLFVAEIPKLTVVHL